MKRIFILALLFSFVAHGKPKGDGLLNQFKGDEGYGLAGCGLGSMIFGPKENQIIAVTFNHLTSTQTFGISTGTMNCGQTRPQVSAADLPEFLELNSQALARDVARGEGETISTLALILNCDQNQLKEILKKNYEKIFVETKLQSAAVEANLNAAVFDAAICHPQFKATGS